jgi:hypothetical protein
MPAARMPVDNCGADTLGGKPEKVGKHHENQR